MDDEKYQEFTDTLRAGLKTELMKAPGADEARADESLNQFFKVLDEAPERKADFLSLYSISGTQGPDFEHFKQTMASLGILKDHVNLNGDAAVRKEEDSRYWRSFRAQMQAILAQENTTEAMRQFNANMDALNDKIKGMDDATKNWLRDKRLNGSETLPEKIRERLEQDIAQWSAVERFERSTKKSLEDIREKCQREASPEKAGAPSEETRKAIQGAIEGDGQLKGHLLDMRKQLFDIRDSLAAEAKEDEAFLMGHRHRKEEMLASFDATIKYVGHKGLKSNLEEIAKELRNDPPNRETIENLKKKIQEEYQQLPEDSKDRQKIEKILEAGEKMGPLFWAVEEQLQNHKSQSRRNETLIKEVEERLALVEQRIAALEKAKGHELSPNERSKIMGAELEKLAPYIKEIEELSKTTKDSIQENKATRGIIEAAEKERLKFVVEKANAAAQNGNFSLWSKDGLKSWGGWALDRLSANNPWGGKEATLVNGEKVTVYQGMVNRLFYTIDENRNRVYLDENNQFKLLNDAGYTPEKLDADRKRRAALKELELAPSLSDVGIVSSEAIREGNPVAAASHTPIPEVAQTDPSRDAAAEVKKTAQLAPAALEQHPHGPVSYEVARSMFPPKDILLAEVKFEHARGETVDPTNEPAALHKIAPPSLVG